MSNKTIYYSKTKIYPFYMLRDRCDNIYFNKSISIDSDLYKEYSEASAKFMAVYKKVEDEIKLQHPKEQKLFDKL